MAGGIKPHPTLSKPACRQAGERALNAILEPSPLERAG